MGSPSSAHFHSKSFHPIPAPLRQPPVHSNAGPLAPHPSSPVTSASVCRMVHPCPCPPDDPTPPATAMATPKPRVSNTCPGVLLSRCHSCFSGTAPQCPQPITSSPSGPTQLHVPASCPPTFSPSLVCLWQNPAWPCAQQPLPSSIHSAIYSLCRPPPHPCPFPSCLPPSTGTFKPEEAVMVASHLSPPHIHSDINSAHFVSQTHLDAQGWLSGSAQQAEEPTTP